MIREASLSDIPALSVLAEEMLREGSYATLSFDEEKLQDMLVGLIDAPNGFVCVYDRDGVVQGALIADLAAPWFSSDLVAQEHALYITPAARGGVAAMSLVGAFINWAVKGGAKQIRTGVSTGASGVAASRIYQAFEMEPVGGLYLLRCHHAPN